MRWVISLGVTAYESEQSLMVPVPAVTCWVQVYNPRYVWERVTHYQLCSMYMGLIHHSIASWSEQGGSSQVLCHSSSIFVISQESPQPSPWLYKLLLPVSVLSSFITHFLLRYQLTIPNIEANI